MTLPQIKEMIYEYLQEKPERKDYLVTIVAESLDISEKDFIKEIDTWGEEIMKGNVISYTDSPEHEKTKVKTVKSKVSSRSTSC